MGATGDFRLSITRALGDQLGDALATLRPAPLSLRSVAEVEERGGVYQLYHHSHLTYIGKADKSLRERLTDHQRKISGRLNIGLADMTFTALYVDEDLSAVAPETLLIGRYRAATSDALPWNFNGFGNKDPGKERDTSKVGAEHFDALFPANLAFVCDHIAAGDYLVGDLLARIKANLPYTFRYKDGNRSKDKQPSDYWNERVDVPESGMAAEDLFSLIALEMPDWQITALPGYVIMYPEQRTYASQRVVY